MVTELGPLLFFMLKYIKAGVADLAIQKKKDPDLTGEINRIRIKIK